MSTPPNDQPPQGQYPPNGYAPEPPKKKRKKWPWIVGIIAVVVILLFAGCTAMVVGAGNAISDSVNESSESSSSDEGTSGSEEVTPSTESGTVELRATASTSGTVIWGDMNGSTNTEQFQGEWSKVIEGTASDEIYTVSVSGDMMDEASEVTCTLLVDGEVKDEATGSGNAGSASCSQPLF